MVTASPWTWPHTHTNDLRKEYAVFENAPTTLTCTITGNLRYRPQYVRGRSTLQDDSFSRNGSTSELWYLSTNHRGIASGRNTFPAASFSACHTKKRAKEGVYNVHYQEISGVSSISRMRQSQYLWCLVHSENDPTCTKHLNSTLYTILVCTD